MQAKLPDSRVLLALSSAKDITSSSDDWQISRLSTSNPIYRVETEAGSWIIRRPPDPAGELLVARLVAALDIAGFGLERLCEGWLVLEDLQLPTLAAHLRAGPAALSTLLFERLGELAMQADLLAMRDRKLNNILLRQSEQRPLELVMIDYEGAFDAGLLDRLFRPGRYMTYLTTRLFFDVVYAAVGDDDAQVDTDELLSHFRDGMLQEQARFNSLPVDSLLSDQTVTWRQRLLLRKRMRSPDRLTACFEQGLSRAARKTRKQPAIPPPESEPRPPDPKP